MIAFYIMLDLFLLALHLLVTLAKVLRPGGVRAVAAESLLLKHQMLISNRCKQRAPNLTSLDRFVLGLTTLFGMVQKGQIGNRGIGLLGPREARHEEFRVVGRES